MTGTDNEKYVRRGKDLVIRYDPGWEEDIRHTNLHKVGAPFQIPRYASHDGSRTQDCTAHPVQAAWGTVGRDARRGAQRAAFQHIHSL